MRVATKEFGVKKAEVLSQVELFFFFLVSSGINFVTLFLKISFQLRYDIPAMYKFHRRKEVDIEVDFWRFEL